jgi:hypothetical protein
VTEPDRAAVIEAVLIESQLEYERLRPSTFAVSLPGDRRLRTACLLTIGDHALSIEAFVVRRPDENREAIYAWLLQRNARMYAVSWSIDDSGDVYLTGKIALSAIDADEVDRILGSVLEYADGSLTICCNSGSAPRSAANGPGGSRTASHWRTWRRSPTSLSAPTDGCSAHRRLRSRRRRSRTR